MLRCQVVAPVAGELEFATVLDGLLKDADTLCVVEAHEVFTKHTFETFDESLINHLVEELEVILAVVECPTHTVLDEIFLQIHQVIEIHESDFRLNHPELCQVARGVGVLGTESRAEGVDGSEGCSTQFTFQLTRNGEGSLLAKEVVIVDDTAVLVLLQVVEVLGRHLEHLTCTLTV